MHHAKLAKSKRLQRVLKLLKRGGAYTTQDIIRKAHVCAVNSIISELRANKKRILCKCEGRGETRVFRYMLAGRA